MAINETSLLGLQDKVALITGAGAGIGEATAKLFERAGMRLALVDIDAARCKELEDNFSGHLAINADVRKKEDVTGIIDKVATHFGKLDVLINNVGDFLRHQTYFVDSTEEQWEELYHINL